MATTTNYGWTTPDDTALVKDGAAAIRTLGSSVDTTTKALNPSTTLGDIEYRSSTANTNTRLGIGTSGQGLQVVAGVPSWAASSTSTLTTTGDLLYASAANTLARRAIGSTGNVLTVSGGLPVWAAPATPATTKSFSLLSTSTLTSGTSTQVTGLSGYDILIVLFKNIRVTDSGNNSTTMKINSVTSGCDFYGATFTPSSTYTTVAQVTTSGSTFKLMNNGTTGGQDLNGYFIISGANTSGVKMITQATFLAANGGSTALGLSGGGTSTDTAVVSSLTIATTGTAFNSGTMYIYGAA